MNKKSKALAAVAAAAFLIVGSMERGQIDEDAARYCRMTAIWAEDAAAGVAPEQRSGWPPFRGECKEGAR